MNPHYAINVFWSEEDAAWIADAPDLRFCTAHGQTREEAVHELGAAMEAWLEGARQNGDPIPEARYKPALQAAE